MIKSKKVQTLLVIVFIILMIILVLLLNDRQNKQKENNYVIVNNASTFFTIASCANRYIEYVASKNIDNIKLVLNKNYSAEEAMSELDNTDDASYYLKPKKIYQAKMSKNNIKYYIYGLLRKEIMDDIDVGTPYYLIVDINTKDYTFSITPYNGEVFKWKLKKVTLNF